jgi:hypothetical protein
MCVPWAAPMTAAHPTVSMCSSKPENIFTKPHRPAWRAARRSDIFQTARSKSHAKVT